MTSVSYKHVKHTLHLLLYVQEIGLLADAKVFSKTKFSMMTSEVLAELDADGKDAKKQVTLTTTIIDSLSFILSFLSSIFHLSPFFDCLVYFQIIFIYSFIHAYLLTSYLSFVHPSFLLSRLPS